MYIHSRDTLYKEIYYIYIAYTQFSIQRFPIDSTFMCCPSLLSQTALLLPCSVNPLHSHLYKNNCALISLRWIYLFIVLFDIFIPRVLFTPQASVFHVNSSAALNICVYYKYVLYWPLHWPIYHVTFKPESIIHSNHLYNNSTLIPLRH